MAPAATEKEQEENEEEQDQKQDQEQEQDQKQDHEQEQEQEQVQDEEETRLVTDAFWKIMWPRMHSNGWKYECSLDYNFGALKFFPPPLLLPLAGGRRTAIDTETRPSSFDRRPPSRISA